MLSSFMEGRFNKLLTSENTKIHCFPNKTGTIVHIGADVAEKSSRNSY